MAAVKGTNSYVDLVEAMAYFEDKLDVAAWLEAPDGQKEQALVTATAMLDQLSWIGHVLDVAQPLAFPRNGSYFDTRLGMYAPLNPTPKRVELACLETAYHLLNNDGMLDSTGQVKSLTVGPISITNIVDVPKLSTVARNYIKDMLSRRSIANMWWRAN